MEGLCNLLSELVSSLTSQRETTDICSLHVQTRIRYRYAHTFIESEVRNTADTTQNVAFTIVVPETAFIVSFKIEDGEKLYESKLTPCPRKNETGQEEEEEIVVNTKTPVSLSNSNWFVANVNVEAQKKVTFKLTYEELLQRRLGTYKYIVNLYPGQIVEDLSVVVEIVEASDITTLVVPAFRKKEGIPLDLEAMNPLATIERISKRTANVKFTATAKQQRKFGAIGLQTQLLVVYDVLRASDPSEILMNDGFFVHFFSPDKLPAMRKHVIFLLDVSGSMEGRKMKKLRQCTSMLLDDLNSEDVFSIVIFCDRAEVWDPSLDKEDVKKMLNCLPRYSTQEWEGIPTPTSAFHGPLAPAAVLAVSPDNVSKAKEFLNQLQGYWTTNLNDALPKAAQVADLGRELFLASLKAYDSMPIPIIICLTDGRTDHDSEFLAWQVSGLTKANATLFGVSFGYDAELEVLNKVSLRCSGTARKIYESLDTKLQLKDFCREFASPLLSEIEFEYLPEQVASESMTKLNFVSMFRGMELVSAGQVKTGKALCCMVTGISRDGSKLFRHEQPCGPVENKHRTLERIWAYLIIPHLWEKVKYTDDEYWDNIRNRVVHLSLKYSFWTPPTKLTMLGTDKNTNVKVHLLSESEWRSAIGDKGSCIDCFMTWDQRTYYMEFRDKWRRTEKRRTRIKWCLGIAAAFVVVFAVIAKVKQD